MVKCLSNSSSLQSSHVACQAGKEHLFTGSFTHTPHDNFFATLLDDLMAKHEKGEVDLEDKVQASYATLCHAMLCYQTVCWCVALCMYGSAYASHIYPMPAHGLALSCAPHAGICPSHHVHACFTTTHMHAHAGMVGRDGWRLCQSRHQQQQHTRQHPSVSSAVCCQCVGQCSRSCRQGSGGCRSHAG